MHNNAFKPICVFIVVLALPCCFSSLYLMPGFSIQKSNEIVVGGLRSSIQNESLVCEISFVDEYGPASLRVYTDGFVSWPGGERKTLRLIRDKEQRVATLILLDEYWLRSPFLSTSQNSFILHLLMRPGDTCQRIVTVNRDTISVGHVDEE
jgi:hypothetical protein